MGKVISNLPVVNSLNRNDKLVADSYTLYAGLTSTISFPLSTLSNNIYPVVNVLDFGAQPTGGITNSTAAVSAAIASVSRQGGTVYFPPGIYNFNTPITIIAKNLTILQNNCILRTTNRPRHDLGEIYHLKSADNLTIQGGILSCNFNSQYQHSGRLTLENTISGGGISKGLISAWPQIVPGFTTQGTFKDLLFKNIEFRSSKTGGCNWFFQGENVSFLGNITFDSCKFIEGECGVYFANYNLSTPSASAAFIENVLFTNCTFSDGACYYNPDLTPPPYQDTPGLGGIPAAGRWPAPYASKEMKLETVPGTNRVRWYGMNFTDKSIGYSYAIDWVVDPNHRNPDLINLNFGGLNVRTFSTSAALYSNNTCLMLAVTSVTAGYGECVTLSASYPSDPYLTRFCPIPFTYSNLDTISGMDNYTNIPLGGYSCDKNTSSPVFSGFRYRFTDYGDGTHNVSNSNLQGYNLIGAGGNSNDIGSYGNFKNFTVERCSFNRTGRMALELFAGGLSVNTTMRNNIFYNSYLQPISIFGKNTKIDNNIFSNNNTRLELGGSHIYITNNAFLSGLQLDAIYGGMRNNIEVANNLVIGRKEQPLSIGSKSAVKNYVIENNNFIQNGATFDNGGCSKPPATFEFNDVENFSFKNNSYTFTGVASSVMGAFDLPSLFTFSGRNINVENNFFSLSGYAKSTKEFYMNLLGLQNATFKNNTVQSNERIDSVYGILYNWSNLVFNIDNYKIWWKNPATGQFEMYSLSGAPGEYQTSLTPSVQVNSFFMVSSAQDFSAYPHFNGWNANPNTIARCTQVSPLTTWEFISIKDMILYDPSRNPGGYPSGTGASYNLDFLPKVGKNNDCYLLFKFSGFSNCVFENNNFTSYDSASSFFNNAPYFGLTFRSTPFFNTLFLNSHDTVNIIKPALGLYKIKSYLD